ncbi:MAG: MCP four helix bundle domain-containing protein [Thiothrix sp.]|uniref:MCP four helix bundle domain-containing protein n=1 Tax=Thiothrix sp. TaxID=1032 RepID=UPI00260A0C3E|nr:MCP four helix bundle domain-containing protein [Thiothrix sp.]MDD5395318.1 MCP four helix bundle domain-containing protein [Thiothrix sp.]
MRKLMQVFFALLVFFLCTPIAHAGIDANAIKSSMMVARENLVAMLDAPDATAQDKHQEEITKASQLVDDAIAAALADTETPPEQAAKLGEFQQVWGAFKKTRDEGIIPAIKAGRKADAKQLATTIQLERVKKMKGILVELGATINPASEPDQDCV